MKNNAQKNVNKNILLILMKSAMCVVLVNFFIAIIYGVYSVYVCEIKTIALGVYSIKNCDPISNARLHFFALFLSVPIGVWYYRFALKKWNRNIKKNADVDQ